MKDGKQRERGHSMRSNQLIRSNMFQLSEMCRTVTCFNMISRFSQSNWSRPLSNHFGHLGRGSDTGVSGAVECYIVIAQYFISEKWPFPPI